MLRTNLRRVQRRIGRRLCFDRGGDAARTVLLAGSGRSGTTWVGDIINGRNDHRVMFEPFHPEHVEMSRRFTHCTYLRPDSDDRAFVEPIEAVLRGAVRGRWVDGQNRCVFPRRRLIKIIRGQLFLRWIAHHHPEIRIVYLIRHPGAVVSSRLAVGWPAPMALILDQPMLMADHLSAFEGIIRAAEDPLERHTVLWCVENYVPLRQFRDGGMHVAFYENLCLDPEIATRDLYRYLGQAFRPALVRRFDLPSTQSRPDSAVRVGGDRVSGWMRHVDDDALARLRAIVATFGLDALYDEACRPCFENGEASLPQIAAKLPAEPIA